ncbi:hypothetical protein NE237_016087 [Protea cynaroides]|uniref:Uncharacterized protein n=1 Tax=Protea cynaroides TaxID=273540 RepID=A0A9Q0KF68_9MAGN|nr:hypothetical protein NE237_016087 [Protea cynaroides]
MVDEVGDGLFGAVGSGLTELIVLAEQLNVNRVFSYSECGEKEGGAASGGGFDSDCVVDSTLFIVEYCLTEEKLQSRNYKEKVSKLRKNSGRKWRFYAAKVLVALELPSHVGNRLQRPET